jgi:hypothetical protein
MRKDRCGRGLHLCTPDCAAGITIAIQGVATYFDAVSGFLGKQISSATNSNRIEKVLMEMVNVLNDTILKCG